AVAATVFSGKHSCRRRDNSRIPTSRSRWQNNLILRPARKGGYGALFHSRTLVPVLRRSDGSDEPYPARDRAGWCDARNDFSANRAAIILHAGSAQAALPSSL